MSCFIQTNGIKLALKFFILELKDASSLTKLYAKFYLSLYERIGSEIIATSLPHWDYMVWVCTGAC
jgi:hypothetical protein